ncbi:hypothetical protein KJ657_01335 [Patescibacteria group bacterium]|nr:hypothetical protein [Patescibacteria group bacterium]MBU1015711.1 hypothetical protein [Patescibacteria group bacterium]MBU1938659.1 hypothetical protein [Patescibacteria group bacterium]
MSLITFIIIHLGVFAFMVEMLRRLTMRHREYPLDENRETLPFGFLRLRHIVVMFIISYIAWVLFSLWLYQLFIGDLL